MDRNVCLATSPHSSRTSHTSSQQQARQATSDHLQTGTTSSTTDTRQPLDSMPSSLTDFVSLRVRIDEQRFQCLDRNSTVSGRTNAFNGWNSWERHSLPAECWWWNMIKDLLFSKENGQEQPLLGLAKMNRSQLADNARHLKIPKTESHARGHLIRLIGRNLMQQSTPEGPDFMGLGEHGANDVKRPSGGSRIPSGAPQDRFLAEDAECSPRAERGEQHGIGATDETHQTTRRREILCRKASGKRTRQT